MKKIFLVGIFSLMFIFLGASFASAATCGDSATPGFSCMNPSGGECKTGLCDGGNDNKCCIQKMGNCGSTPLTKGLTCGDKKDGTNCKTGYCSGNASIQCCSFPETNVSTTTGATTGDLQGATTDPVIPKNKALPNPLGITSVNALAARIINFVLGLVGTVSLVLFVYGGVIWMTSAGSPEKVRKGRDIIIWAVVGMAVVFMAYTMVRFVIEGLQGV